MKTTHSLVIGALLAVAASSSVARTSLEQMDAKLDQINAKVDTVQATLDSRAERRFVQNTSIVLDGSNPQFQLIMTCDEPYRVESFIITARDAGGSVDINFFRASVLSTPFGTDLTPPFGWEIGHTDYSITIGAASAGHEMLSNMGIPQLGLVDTTFNIFGTRSPNTQATTLIVGATVETSADPANECTIGVFDS